MESTQQRTVLVLEDERALGNAIREAFLARGFNPIVVVSIADGFTQLENQQQIDVIWLDHYLLGSGNGLDFVVKLKQNEKWSKIPIFVVSNNESASNIRSYIELGVSNYYTKADYDINQIINDIEYSLQKGV